MVTGIRSFDFKSRWLRAVALMKDAGIDALFLMKPANLAYLTGDGRPCALGLLTRAARCIVAVPASDLRSVQETSAATDIRVFRSEEEMFHGFRDVLREERLSEATIAIEKNFFDAALFEVFTFTWAANLAGVLLALGLLGVEVWIVAIAVLADVVSREAITASVLTRAAIVMGASAIAYVVVVILMATLVSL